MRKAGVSTASSPPQAPAPQPDDQVSLLDLRAQQVCDVLEKLTVETLTPIEALNELYQLKKMLE